MRASNLSHSGPARTGEILLAVAGAVLLGLAWILSPARLEDFVLGQSAAGLQWGPALFRSLLAFHGAVLIGLSWFGLQRLDKAEARTAEASVSRAQWVVLGLLCALALALRLWQLGGDLWYDEVHTLLEYARPPIRQIVASFSSQNQHMLYSVLAHLSLSTLGESAAALRLPAALFGAASIWALFRLGTLTNGARESLLAAAIMTVSYHHIWFSQNARGYTGLLFFTLLATDFWIRASRHPRLALWIGYIVSASLGLWVHMTMIFVVAAHGISYLAVSAVARGASGGARTTKYRWWEPLLAWTFAGTLTLQLYALSLPEFLRTALHEEALSTSEWTDPTWFLREAVQRLADIGILGIIPFVGLAILTAGCVSLWRRDWPSTLVMMLPGVLGGATMIGLGHPLWPRFFFFCMGFLLLMIVRGCMAVPELLLVRGSGSTANGRHRVAAATGTLVVLLLAVGSLLTVPRAYRPKQDFTGARDFVLHNKQEQDASVAVGLAGEMFEIYYAPAWPILDDRSDLEQLESRYEQVWLIYTLPVHLQAWHPELWETIQTDYEVVRVFAGTLGGGDVVVCRSRRGV